ncbi:endonuclease domain-containing protein [Nocardioides panacihumi]|uniref:endonuclease domain-containing protein n=1 Tax=Nocardioides panacihumi TaxID=400774 RepID=UPI0031DCD47C
MDEPLLDADPGLVPRALVELGGVASRSALVGRAGRASVDRALARGRIVAVRRGWYGSPELGSAAATARAAGGRLCLESAALHHGWPVKQVPEVPHVLLARGRKVPRGLVGRAVWHRGDLSEECDDVATGKELTLAQCCRSLPFDAALAVADSARRAGESALLTRVGRLARGPGAPRIRRVVAESRAEAANPFESVLRAICLGVAGLKVRPQVLITSTDPWSRPDLVDEDHRIVIEADSFEWHGDRGALRRDARRYNLLVADGWLVLRFSWEDVMFDQDYVAAVLAGVVALVHRYTEAVCRGCVAA